MSPSDNPVLITGAGAIAATVAGADAIDRSAGVDWRIANFGAISSTSAYGVNRAGAGDVSNSGSISGRGGCLSDGGSLTNSAGGTITAAGVMPAPLAAISAISIVGPSDGARGAHAYEFEYAESCRGVRTISAG